MDNLVDNMELEYSEPTFGSSVSPKSVFAKSKQNGQHNSNPNTVTIAIIGESNTEDIPIANQSTSETLASFLEIQDKDLQEKTVEYLDDPSAYFHHIEQEDTMKVFISCGLFFTVVLVTFIMMFTMNPPM